MVRAVHRPQVQFLLAIELHRRVHVLLVVRQVARLVVQRAAGNFGRVYLRVAFPPLVFMREQLELLADDVA